MISQCSRRSRKPYTIAQIMSRCCCAGSKRKTPCIEERLQLIIINVQYNLSFVIDCTLELAPHGHVVNKICSTNFEVFCYWPVYGIRHGLPSYMRWVRFDAPFVSIAWLRWFSCVILIYVDDGPAHISGRLLESSWVKSISHQITRRNTCVVINQLRLINDSAI